MHKIKRSGTRKADYCYLVHLCAFLSMCVRGMRAHETVQSVRACASYTFRNGIKRLEIIETRHRCACAYGTCAFGVQNQMNFEYIGTAYRMCSTKCRNTHECITSKMLLYHWPTIRFNSLYNFNGIGQSVGRWLLHVCIDVSALAKHNEMETKSSTMRKAKGYYVCAIEIHKRRELVRSRETLRGILQNKYS